MVRVVAIYTNFRCFRCSLCLRHHTGADRATKTGTNAVHKEYADETRDEIAKRPDRLPHFNAQVEDITRFRDKVTNIFNYGSTET